MAGASSVLESRVNYAPSHWGLAVTLWSICSHYPHFTDADTGRREFADSPKDRRQVGGRGGIQTSLTLLFLAFHISIFFLRQMARVCARVCTRFLASFQLGGLQ